MLCLWSLREGLAPWAGGLVGVVGPGMAMCAETGRGLQPAGLGRGRRHSPCPALPPAHGFALLQVVVVGVLGAVP